MAQAIIKVNMDGKRATAKSTATNPKKKGSSPLVTWAIESLEIEQAAKILTATGGVMAPITPPRQTINPNSIAVNPMAEATGHNTGTRSTQIAVPSRKVPKKRTRTAINTQNNLGLMFIEVMTPTMALDMLE